MASPEFKQERQPGISARDRILGATRYAPPEDGAVDRCVSTLGAESDPMVAEAEADLEERKKEKAAAKQARREEAAQARLMSASKAGGGQPVGEAAAEKKKKKKKAKIEATVIDSTKPFVPHEKRISVLLGISDS